MASRTKIEWTDASWNPIRARDKCTGKVGHYCELVSSGCAHCYASAMQKRFGMPAYPGQSGGERDLEVFLDDNVLKQPLSWGKPRRVFVCSMTDLFGSWVDEQWLRWIFEIMAACPRHTFQILTKRPERMRELLKDKLPRRDAETPLPNVWLGVSVEDQERADERIPLLLQTPAAVRFLSCEPLLRPLNLFAVGPLRQDVLHGWVPAYGDFPEGANTQRIDWVIVGGESGGSARVCSLAWIRGIVEQCRDAGVPIFVKQLGRRATLTDANLPIRFTDRKGSDMGEFPEDLKIREFPSAIRL